MRNIFAKCIRLEVTLKVWDTRSAHTANNHFEGIHRVQQNITSDNFNFHCFQACADLILAGLESPMQNAQQMIIPIIVLVNESVFGRKGCRLQCLVLGTCDGAAAAAAAAGVEPSTRGSSGSRTPVRY